jgi:hypothetical protein
VSAITLRVDASKFDRALRLYLANTKKDVSDVLNSKAGDVALRAAQFSPKASAAEIKDVWRTYDWWPKYINKVLKLGGAKLHLRRKVKTDAEANVWHKEYGSANKHGAMKFGRKTMGYDRALQSGANNKDKIRLSKQILKRRASRAGSFRAVFGVTALRFGKNAGKFIRQGRDFAIKFKKATPDSLLANFVTAFRNTKKPWPGGTRPSASQDVMAKVKIANIALQAGLTYVATDMAKHVLDKLQKQAAK